MLEINKQSNLLEQDPYKYSLQDVEEPNLYRDLYPYVEVPKIPFNHRHVPIGMPDENYQNCISAFREYGEYSARQG